MALRHQKLTGTTDGSGDLTVTGEAPVNGFLHSITWIDGDLADNNTAVLSITGTNSGVDRTLHTQVAGEGDDDKSYYPRVLEHDNSAVELSTYTYQVLDGYLKLVIAAGGASKTGGCIVNYFD